ncbi:MAG: DegT/DnrJ/EryC1/StrS family aminotransferase [candidate division WOR-3 bacterium]
MLRWLLRSNEFKRIYNKYFSNRIKIRFEVFDKVNKEISKNFQHELKRVLNLKNDIEILDYEEKFYKLFKKIFNGRYCIGTNSGRVSLYLSLIANRIKKGDEVIISSFTPVYPVISILQAGCKPKFVEIDEKTFTIDPGEIEDKISEKTKFIIPIHLYGNSCEMEKILKLAKKHDQIIIEDCAQALFTTYKGKMLPFTDIGCFSFYTGKIIGGFGYGGLIVTKNKKFVKRVKNIMNPLSNSLLVLQNVGPVNLEVIQMAFIKSKLPFTNKWIRKRREIAKIYDEELNGYVDIPKVQEKTFHTYYRYVIRTKHRDKLFFYLLRKGVETKIDPLYPAHLHEIVKKKCGKISLPITEKVGKEILALPSHQYMKEEDVFYVTKLIKNFLR